MNPIKLIFFIPICSSAIYGVGHVFFDNHEAIDEQDINNNKTSIVKLEKTTIILQEQSQQKEAAYKKKFDIDKKVDHNAKKIKQTTKDIDNKKQSLCDLKEKNKKQLDVLNAKAQQSASYLDKSNEEHSLVVEYIIKFWHKHKKSEKQESSSEEQLIYLLKEYLAQHPEDKDKPIDPKNPLYTYGHVLSRSEMFFKNNISDIKTKHLDEKDARKFPEASKLKEEKKNIAIQNTEKLLKNHQHKQTGLNNQSKRATTSLNQKEQQLIEHVESIIFVESHMSNLEN